MARRGDLFAVLATLNERGTTPYWAVLAVAIVIAALVSIGDVRATWSFSAFSVLIYYSLTNLAPLRMPASERLYPRWIAGIGFVACLVLAFWVERAVWLIGLALIAIGLAWQARRRTSSHRQTHGRT
jgi:APA family basic amino acid/polyamine antiporter